MGFIKIYNEDGSYNSLLNVNFIAKIDDGVPFKDIKGKKYYQIEYSLGYRFEEALIMEEDYKQLTTNLETNELEDKPKKTTKKEKEDK